MNNTHISQVKLPHPQDSRYIQKIDDGFKQLRGARECLFTEYKKIYAEHEDTLSFLKTQGITFDDPFIPKGMAAMMGWIKADAMDVSYLQNGQYAQEMRYLKRKDADLTEKTRSIMHQMDNLHKSLDKYLAAANALTTIKYVGEGTIHDRRNMFFVNPSGVYEYVTKKKVAFLDPKIDLDPAYCASENWVSELKEISRSQKRRFYIVHNPLSELSLPYFVDDGIRKVVNNEKKLWDEWKNKSLEDKFAAYINKIISPHIADAVVIMQDQEKLILDEEEKF